jgi:hypothetical protein
MATDEKAEAMNPEELSTATRRDFMKVAGVGAMGLAYSHPIVETLQGSAHQPPSGVPPEGENGDGSSSEPGSEPSSS